MGDDVLKSLKEKDTDKYGLYRWHLERTLGIIDTLKEKYGERAVDIIKEKQLCDRRELGAQIAKGLAKNFLEDIIPFFAYGNDENIIEKKRQTSANKSYRLSCR